MSDQGAQIDIKFKKLVSTVEPSALSYLRGQGWDLQHSKLAADAKAGKLVKRAGYYYAKDINSYAKTWCKISSTVSGSPEDTNTRDSLDLEKLREQRLKNDIREGLYVLRAKHEQDLAARAAYLKTDLSNYGPRIVTLLMEKMADLLRDSGVTLPETVNLQAFVPDLEQHYDEALDEYLHQYATRKVASVVME